MNGAPIKPTGSVQFSVNGSKWVKLTGAVVHLEQAADEAAEAVGRFGQFYATSFTRSFAVTLTPKQHRLAIRNIQRLMRRPALIHNGGKPA
jgi:hypothetical protein